MQGLVKEGLVSAKGNTRQRFYGLVTLTTKTVTAPLLGLEEDRFWRQEVAPLLAGVRENVFKIWQYGFTEMVNNAIDHSGGAHLTVTMETTAATTTLWIADNGVGIFRKIQAELGLEDERHAILELAKGKLTTDPKRHTGEGIFFTSRMFDDYRILSGGVFFSHKTGEEEDWILDHDRPREGTTVFMSLRNRSDRTVKQIFDKYTASPKDFGFNRTIVPVRLAKHGAEQLVSRSQAKRLLARFERFKVVILDFAGIDEIGQAFADEIFRVYSLQHPEVRIVPANAGPEVKRSIRRAKIGNP
ncbi:MAG: STAS-like domain-containing protein [Deltaproteobacteria bacterium]|nr:STAS-like domain-containing protein [Deltaproteobacteria bacterium]